MSAMGNAKGGGFRLRAAIICMATLALWTLMGCDKKTAPTEKVPVTMADSLEYLTPRADAGDTTALVWLGQYYLLARGGVRDTTKAIGFLKRAIVAGALEAGFELGEAYLDGTGVDQSYATAYAHFSDAASRGHATAIERMGRMMLDGMGVEKNATRAFELIRQSADRGDVRGAYWMGICYEEGRGTEKNAVRASEWFTRSADGGDVDAAAYLAYKYTFGKGIAKDLQKAFRYGLQGAVGGNDYAQSITARNYFIGQGVAVDKVLGYAWANVAAVGGDKDYVRRRDFVEKMMLPNQIAEGQRLASAWRVGKDIRRESNDDSYKGGGSSESGKVGTGTAFVISPDGLALTNHHVVDDIKELRVAGHEGAVVVVAQDIANDLAVVRLPFKPKGWAEFAPDPSSLRLGADLVVFGYPLNSMLASQGNVTAGTLSALSGLGNNASTFQFTAPIQPGSSGSPVMDKTGRVVGIVYSKLSDSEMAEATGQIGQNVNFAVNQQTVRAFLDANRIPYRKGWVWPALQKSNADIAASASKWTVLIERWQ